MLQTKAIFITLLILLSSIEAKVEPKKFLSFASMPSTYAITKVGGYGNGGYVQWTGSTTDKYTVYIQSGSTSTPIDNMLIRQYPTFYRADVVDLKPGMYTFKIVGKSSGTLTSSSFTASSYDRSGFTFGPKSPVYKKGVGAYNLDGTLKPGAQVLYITEKTKKKVTMTINGKTYTGVAAITQQIKDANKVGPVAIRIIGQVTLDGMESTDMKGSYSIGVKLASQVTFEGIGKDATLMCGVSIQNSNDIEVRNLGFMLWGGGVDGDAVTLRRSSAVWVHNNDLFYGLKGPDGDQAKGDGSVDLKDDSKFVTISYNHFWDSGKSSLCGLKKETGPNYITYHHNWFDHSDSRHPRIRTMSVHVYNNYYEGVFSYGVGVTTGGSAFVESNYFKNTRYPMFISRQGSETKEKIYLSEENGGIIKSYGNVMVNQVSWVPYEKNKVEFDSYDVKKRTDQVPNTVKAKLGGATYNNFDTDSSVMYTYTPDAAQNVPSIVMSKAGRVNKGDFKFTFGTTDETKKLNSNLMNQLTAYKTQLVSVGS